MDARLESYVLFNTNLLSTGVDLPCCDGVVLVSPSTKRRTVLQRWGRSLRVEAHREDKEGTLALVAEDPLEPTELVEARAQALGIQDSEVLKDDNQLLDAEKFRTVLRTAEAAASSSYKVLGDVFDIVAQFRRQSSRRPSAGTKMVVFPGKRPALTGGHVPLGRWDGAGVPHAVPGQDEDVDAAEGCGALRGVP